MRLSPQGTALHQALREARRGVAASLLQGCDSATQARLLELLAQVRSHVEAAGGAETLRKS